MPWPYRDDHPGQSMEIATVDDLCGTCHRSTVAEWRTSNHGQAGIACVACHEVHSQKTHMQTDSDALCAGCHERDALWTTCTKPTTRPPLAASAAM
ncbi:MAG: cytochrome c3 family protein [Caldilineales bacterium]